MLEVELPYTKPPLSLNDRLHWSQRYKIEQQVHSDVILLAKAHRLKGPRLHLRLHYRPARNGRRDADNLMATMKPIIDGLVLAGVVTDDTKQYVTWGMPQIHEAEKGQRGRLWLEVR